MKTLLCSALAGLAFSAMAEDVKTMTKNNEHAYGGYGTYGDYSGAAKRDNEAWVWDDGTTNTPDSLPDGSFRYVVETIGDFAQVGDTFAATLWLSNSLSRTNINACRIRPRKTKWTFSDLHLFPATSVISLGGNWNEIAGQITFHGTEECPVTFLPGGGKMCQKVSATLKGDGLVRFMSTEYAYPNNAITNRLTGANTGFAGAIDVTTTGFSYDYETGAYGYRDESKRNWMALWIDSEENLGANPAAFTYNALRLRNGGPLYVSSDVTIDDANRGIYVEGAGVMAVAAGKTLAVKVPVRVDGTLVKQGAGTLALGGRLDGTGEAPVLYRNRVRVEEGRVKPLTAQALNGAQLVVAADAAVEIDATAEDSDFKEYGLVLAKSETVAPFAQESGVGAAFVVTGVEAFETAVSVPLVTVRSVFADTVRGKIAATVDADGVAVTVVESEGTLDGVAVTTFAAKLARTSGSFTGETVTADVVLRDGETVVAAAADHAVTFTALTVDGGAFGLTKTTSAGAPGTVVLSGESKVAQRPIRIEMDETFTRPEAATAWTVLKLASALGSFTADDFILSWAGTDRTGKTGAYDAALAVSEENGETVVNVVFKTLKTMTKGTGSSTSSQMKWDDGTTSTASDLPSDDYAYRVVDIGNFWLFSKQRFGATLSLFSTGSSAYSRILPASQTGTTLDDCHLYSGTGIGGNGKANALNEICGKITIHGSDVTNAVGFSSATAYCNLDIRAALYGEGPLRVATSVVDVKYMPDGNVSTIQLSGDNRNWTGPLQVTCAGGKINFDNETAAAWGKYETEWKAYDAATGEFMHLYPCTKKDGTALTSFNTNYVVFPLLDEKCLGGNPRAFRRDQFLFGGACRLVVTNDVTVSAPNRGVTFECAPHVVVDDGATLTLKSPLCLAGTVWKDGAGTLRLGSTAETMFVKERSAANAVPFAQYNRLRIEDGALALQVGKVLDGVSLRLASGTRVEFDWADADEALKAYGLYNAKTQNDGNSVPFEWLDGVGLAVKVRYTGVTAENGEKQYKIPLVTVRTTAADAVASHLTADVRLKGYETSAVQSETIEESGVSLTRFYVTCKRQRGLLVIIR